MMKGFATPEGTERFKKRFSSAYDESHFRQKLDLWFSSIGIGSYLGDADDATDQKYEESLQEALSLGINVIDSAINYRHQRSERVFGKAIANLVEMGKVQRDELIVCTKGGFIPFEGEYPENPAEYFSEQYLKSQILTPEDVIQNCHAMTPKYLENQLARSLQNLGLETIDIYYVHNPEIQLTGVDRREFLNRMRAAFEMLESKVQEGSIRYYGTATWEGYRVLKDQTEHLSLEELMVVAREVGGPNHHFRAVQLPFNLAMPEAWIVPSQPFAANSVPFLGVAERLGVIAIASASLLQSRLTGAFPEFLLKHFGPLKTSAQRAIQFARSAPGMTTALVGMKSADHVRENMETAKESVLSADQLLKMFQEKNA